MRSATMSRKVRHLMAAMLVVAVSFLLAQPLIAANLTQPQFAPGTVIAARKTLGLEQKPQLARSENLLVGKLAAN